MDSVRVATNDAVEDVIRLISEHLRENPAKAIPALALVKGDQLLYSNESANDDGIEKPFHETYTVLQQVPIQFLKTFLPTLGNDSLTEAVLHQLEKANRGTTQALFMYACCVSGKTKWPKSCKEKQVFRVTFGRWHTMCGDRLKHISVAKNSDGKLVVQWDVCGVWQFHPAAAQQKTHAKHLPTKVEYKLTEPILLGVEQAKVHKNALELGAFIQLGRRSIPVCDLLEESDVKGLKSWDPAEELTRLAVAATAEHLAATMVTPVKRKRPAEVSRDEAAADEEGEDEAEGEEEEAAEPDAAEENAEEATEALEPPAGSKPVRRVRAKTT